MPEISLKPNHFFLFGAMFAVTCLLVITAGYYTCPDIYTCRDREINISSFQYVTVIKMFQIKHKMGTKVMC